MARDEMLEAKRKAVLKCFLFFKPVFHLLITYFTFKSINAHYLHLSCQPRSINVYFRRLTYSIHIRQM